MAVDSAERTGSAQVVGRRRSLAAEQNHLQLVPPARANRILHHFIFIFKNNEKMEICQRFCIFSLFFTAPPTDWEFFWDKFRFFLRDCDSSDEFWTFFHSLDASLNLFVQKSLLCCFFCTYSWDLREIPGSLLAAENRKYSIRVPPPPSANVHFCRSVGWSRLLKWNFGPNNGAGGTIRPILIVKFGGRRVSKVQIFNCFKKPSSRTLSLYVCEIFHLFFVKTLFTCVVLAIQTAGFVFLIWFSWLYVLAADVW